jgi:hypothetical protein
MIANDLSRRDFEWVQGQLVVGSLLADRVRRRRPDLAEGARDAG